MCLRTLPEQIQGVFNEQRTSGLSNETVQMLLSDCFQQHADNFRQENSQLIKEAKNRILNLQEENARDYKIRGVLRYILNTFLARYWQLDQLRLTIEEYPLIVEFELHCQIRAQLLQLSSFIERFKQLSVDELMQIPKELEQS